MFSPLLSRETLLQHVTLLGGQVIAPLGSVQISRAVHFDLTFLKSMQCLLEVIAGAK